MGCTQSVAAQWVNLSKCIQPRSNITHTNIFNIQGCFFNCSALKMTKCQTHWKIWHLELFWWDLQCNLTLSHSLGRNSIKNHPVIVSSAVLHHDALADLRSKCDPWYRCRCHLDGPGDPKDSNNNPSYKQIWTFSLSLSTGQCTCQQLRSNNYNTQLWRLLGDEHVF